MNTTERIPLELLQSLKNISYTKFKELTPRCKSEKERKEYYKSVQNYIQTSIRSKGISIKNYYFVEGTMFGRKYCGNSIQGIASDIRGFLFRDSTTDLDIENCHPKLLEYICKKNKLECPSLTYYNQNRKTILDRIPNGKEIFLKSVNSDKLNKSCKDELFRAFDKEMKFIQKKLYTMKEYQFIVTTIPKDRSYNCLGSNINRILCFYENEVLEKIVKVLTQHNIEVAALMFDGCMIYGNHYSNMELIAEMEEMLSDYGLKLKYKEHSTLLQLDDFKEEDIVDDMTEIGMADLVIQEHPYWKYCQNKLYCFDNDTGMWVDDSVSHFKVISAILRKKCDSCIITSKRISSVIHHISSMSIDSEWITKNCDSGLGKLLFTNGYYDGEFHTDFNPDILFFSRIPHPYVEMDADYLDDIQKRFFYNPLGKETGEYYMELLSRGLFGDKMKQIAFCLGKSNTGKSTITKAFQASAGEYTGIFNAECFTHKQTSQDEAQLLRWAFLSRFKRNLFSNELNVNTKLNGNMIKKIASGGDTLIGRVHGGLETSFVPHYFCSCFANDISEISPYDDAVKNRLSIISYDKIFVDNPTEPNHLQKDYQIEKEIQTIKFQQSFIRLMIRSYSNFKQNGEMKKPEKVLYAMKEWIAQDSDIMATFTNDFEFVENEFTPSSVIKEWIKTRGLGMSDVKIAKEIKEYASMKGYVIDNKVKKVDGKGCMVWFGIKEL